MLGGSSELPVMDIQCLRHVTLSPSDAGRYRDGLNSPEVLLRVGYVTEKTAVFRA